MVTPTFSVVFPNVQVAVFGRGIHFNPDDARVDEQLRIIEERARACGANRVTWQRVPTPKHSERRWMVHTTAYENRTKDVFAVMHDVRADGVILTEAGEAVAVLTRDCPSVILASKYHGHVAWLHAGRDSLHGIDTGNPKQSVIHNMLEACMPYWKDPASVFGLISCGIEPECFPNDRYPDILHGLTTMWGPSVIHDSTQGTLNLRELVLLQLEAHGIRREHIFHDGLGTFSDPLLASNRAGDTTVHNLIMVTRTS